MLKIFIAVTYGMLVATCCANSDSNTLVFIKAQAECTRSADAYGIGKLRRHVLVDLPVAGQLAANIRLRIAEPIITALPQRHIENPTKGRPNQVIIRTDPL